MHRVTKKHGKVSRNAFTLVEVMVATAIFVVAFSGVFLAHGQCVRLLDGMRQVSRAEDVALANVEFLRTRSWTQLTNLVASTSASSNMIEQIPYSSSSIVSTLTLVDGDPKQIGLRNVSRVIQMTPYPTSSASEGIRKCTVLVIWESIQQRTHTNSMTVYLTKGGMTADVY